MEYIEVESSQIAAVGFGDGIYGPETLGIKFPPNKKQVEAELPGSEYHYKNVPRTAPDGGVSHDALMASDSIGSYFTMYIKRNPERYPFTKVEADPTQPDQSSGNGSTRTSKMDTAPSTPTTEDAPTTSIALAIIDTISDDLLFTPGAVTDAQLATGRDWYLTEAKKYDISTEKARTELKRFARPLQKLRTGIEARAKELTGATKRKIAAIDAEKRRLVLVVGGIEDDVLRPLTEWEQEEDARKMRLAHDVNAFAEAGQPHLYPDTVSMGAAIYELENADISGMQEYKVGAESAIAASLRVLKPELARRQQAEIDAKELAELRRKQAEREEADRLAEAKRQEQARIDAAVEAAKAAARQEVIAEMAVPEPVIFRPVSEMDCSLLEPEDSPELIQAVQPFVYPEIPPPSQPAPFKSQEDEIVEALRACALTRIEAEAVFLALEEGRIPHVTIIY